MEKAGKRSKCSMTVEEIIEIATKTAISVYDQQKKAELKEKHDKRLRSTKMLLENYRNFSSYNDNAVSNLYDALKIDEDIYDVLELMEGREKVSSDIKIDSIEKGVLRTKIMMAHVDAMLEIYHKHCQSSPYPEEMRRYRVVYGLYIGEEEKRVEQIAEEECCDIATVYRDKKNAITKLTALIFGIDGIMLKR